MQRSALLLLGLAVLADAAEPDYFPLYPLSRWVYRCAGATCPRDVPPVDALRTAEFGGRSYTLVRWFQGREVWLRLDEAGTLWNYDPRTRQERRWYDFQAPEGGGYETAIDACNPSARIGSRRFRFQGAIGSFDNALQILYPPAGCADAGLTEEIFLPGIGLARRTETTIAGPCVYDVVSARIGNATEYAGQQVAFRLALDRSVYTANLMPPVDPRRAVPQMTARLMLRNTTPQPLELRFASGQIYDLVLKNDTGDVVYRWSEGKAFTMALQTITVEPGTEKNYAILAPLQDKASNPLPQGRYTAEAWLATMGPRLYSASAGFELRHVF